MPFKIDTKEKFNVICPADTLTTAIMTDELGKCLENCLTQDVKNVIINLKDTQNLEDAAALELLNWQGKFMDAGVSFVVCEANDSIQQQLENLEIDDVLNLTPTESEAWDLVHMDEIERELLGGDEI